MRSGLTRKFVDVVYFIGSCRQILYTNEILETVLKQVFMAGGEEILFYNCESRHQWRRGEISCF